MKMKKNNFGFTLVELLVVIGIIALLVSILMPALSSAREQAKKTVCAANLKTFGIGLQMYAHENNDFIPPAADPANAATQLTAPNHFYMIMALGTDLPSYLAVGTSERVQLSRDNHEYPANKTFRGIGYFIKENTLDYEGGEIFYCPSGTAIPFSYKHYGGDKWPYPSYTISQSGSEINPSGVRSNYSYMPQHRSKTLELDGQQWPIMALKFGNVDPARNVMRDLLQDQEKLSHKGTGASSGCNMVFIDGHVKFGKDEDMPFIYSDMAGVDPLWDKLMYRKILKALDGF